MRAAQLHLDARGGQSGQHAETARIDQLHVLHHHDDRPSRHANRFLHTREHLRDGSEIDVTGQHDARLTAFVHETRVKRLIETHVLRTSTSRDAVEALRRRTTHTACTYARDTRGKARAVDFVHAHGLVRTPLGKAVTKSRDVETGVASMSETERTEKTAGGLLGQIVGKAKAAVGSLVGNEDLQREGNLQNAHAEAEVLAERERQEAEQRKQEATVAEQRAEAAAERDRLRAELEAEERREKIEEAAARTEASLAADAARKKATADAREATQEAAADAAERAAMQRRAADNAAARKLEEEARRAELEADTIAPEAK